MYQGTIINYMYLVVLFYGWNGVDNGKVFLFQVLDEKITYAKHKIQLSEIEKSGGVLSNLVLFLKKTSLPKEIVSTITSRDVTMYSEVNFMWTPVAWRHNVFRGQLHVNSGVVFVFNSLTCFISFLAYISFWFISLLHRITKR